jgi:tRNA(Arg) A34 adenosine deaminase TadA
MSDPVDIDVLKGFMEEALALAAQAAAEGEVPVGAVVVHAGKVIAVGWNRREQDQDFSAHAEFIAMREAARVLGSWRLVDCTVFVTLEPCPMCAGAMVQARVGRCVFAAADPKAGFVGSLADLSAWPGLNHRFEVTSGVLAEESAAMLQSFFRGLRRR